MSETVIQVENVSKLYRLGEVGTGSLAHDVNRWWHRVRGKEDPYRQVGEANDREKKGNSDYAWALRGVSFEVKQGEVLGVIGRNGAGKSTLLKILSRVTTQTEGRIKIKGRIASLLEVGTGFHPELTGRENIFLNGAILGMRKAEIARKFDEIVEFSGCARYIDTPVKRYSSGMYVRLAFAVAAHLEPEILIVDEVLAVGDAEFQKKCLGKIKDVAGNGRTILFVSHNMAAIANLCKRILILQNGIIHGHGDTQPIIEQYLRALSRNSVKCLRDIPRQGNGKGRITGYAVLNKDGTPVESIQTGKDVALVFFCEFEHAAIGSKIDIGFGIHGPMDERLFVHYASMGGETFFVKGKKQNFRFDLSNLPLNPGSYTVFPRIEIDTEEADFPQFPVGEITVTEGDYYGTGKPTNNKGSCCLLIQGKWREHSI